MSTSRTNKVAYSIQMDSKVLSLLQHALGLLSSEAVEEFLETLESVL